MGDNPHISGGHLMATFQLTEAQKALGRHWLSIIRRQLHPVDQDLAGVERHADQMAAIGRAVRP